MARTTKQLSGGGKDKLIRDMIGSESGIPSTAADQLAKSMCAAIKTVRVDVDVWEQHKAERAKATASQTTTTAATPNTVTPPAQNASGPAAFDPFAFSALAVLTKQGADELASRLGRIADVADLHALAKAQHLAVDTALSDPVALRTALVKAAEVRLAERRAAAS